MPRRDPELWTLATATAAALTADEGQEWKVSDHGHPDYPGVYLDGAGDQVLYLRRDPTDHSNTGRRLVLAGNYPQGHSYYFRTDEGDVEHPTIGTTTRDGAKLARDAQRRLLPGYRRTLERVKASMLRDFSAHAMRSHAAQVLAAVVPGARIKADDRNHSHTVEWYSEVHGNADVDLSYDGSGVSELKIRGLTAVQVERMLRALVDER
jgi:hypothetical protein